MHSGSFPLSVYTTGSAEAGGGTKSLLLSDLSHGIYQFSSPENDKSSSQTHSFTKECSSRLSFSSGPSPHGVVSGQGSVSSVCWIFSLLSIDLFATCMNAQLPAYVCSVSGSVRGGSGNPVKSLGIFREFLSPFLLGRCSYLFCFSSERIASRGFCWLLLVGLAILGSTTCCSCQCLALLLPLFSFLLPLGHWVALKPTSRVLLEWMLLCSPSPLLVTLAKLPRGWLKQVGLPLSHL